MTPTQNQALRQQSLFLSQLAAKTIPKGLFCLAMRLTMAYANLADEDREFPGRSKLEDNSLYHYALFSDNVLAAAVVVNSTVHNAKVRACWGLPSGEESAAKDSQGKATSS